LPQRIKGLPFSEQSEFLSSFYLHSSRKHYAPEFKNFLANQKEYYFPTHSKSKIRVVALTARTELFHFIYNYNSTDWNQFKLILDSRIDIDFSLDRIESVTQIDTMINTITTALLEARTAAVPKVRPFRYSLVLTPEVKSLITLKNTQRRIAQRSRNEQEKSQCTYNVHCCLSRSR
jgi:hypothetical protein